MEKPVNGRDVRFPKDLAAFQDFERLSRSGDLKSDHVVMVKVARWAKGIAYKFNAASRADDLGQDCLMALLASGYSGQASLDTFIVKVLLSKNIAAWRKDGAKRQAEMPVDLKDEVSSEFSQAIEARLSSDDLLDDLLRSNDKLFTTVVEIISQAEHSIGRQRIAELASERLQRVVNRYQVEMILKKLRDRLEKRRRRTKRKNTRTKPNDGFGFA